MVFLVFFQTGILVIYHTATIGAVDACDWLFEILDSKERANNSIFFKEKLDRELFINCFHDDGNLINWIKFTENFEVLQNFEK